MVILNKEKTTCAEYNRVTVQRSYGNGKEKKYALVGYVHHSADILDTYSTKEEAVTALEKIYAAYQNGEKAYAL